MYINANNLYGWAMSQFLPYGGFKFVDHAKFSLDEIEKKILSHPDDAKRGYILLILNIQMNYTINILIFH